MNISNLKRKVLVHNKWLNLLEDQYELPNGTEISYYHAQQNDGVMSIVLTELDSVMSTYIVNQYRHPIGRDIWQFPLGGFNATTQEPEIAARVELLEECGIVVESMQNMGCFYANPGFTNQKIHVFISDEIIRITAPKLEETEFGLISKTVPVAAISDMISSGEMGDAWGITGLHYVNKYLQTLQCQ